MFVSLTKFDDNIPISLKNKSVTFNGTATLSQAANNSFRGDKSQTDKKSSQHPFRKLGILFAGALAAIYAIGVGVRLHYKTNIHNLALELSEVFRRDVSESEARQIANKYKDLFKINNAEDFIKKSYEQIKKDYGYEKAEVPLNIEYKGKYYFLKHPFKNVYGGGFNNSENWIKIAAFCNEGGKISKAEKSLVFQTLFHELKHMEQSHLCYLKDKDKFFKELIKNSKSNGQKFNIMEEHSLKKSLKANYNNAYKNVPEKDVNKYSGIIDKYIENAGNYKDPKTFKMKEYKEQILEKDARKAGKTAGKIIFIDKNPLYLPKAPIPIGLAGLSAGCFITDGITSINNNH